MAKHRKEEPKKISLLATTGGLFAAILLTAGLFGASQIIGSAPNAPDQQEQELIPSKTRVVSNDATAITSIPSVLTQVPEQGFNAPVVPGSLQSPTQNPRPEPNPGTPISGPGVSVDIDADTPIVDLDVDADVAIPLLGPVADTAEDVTNHTGETVKDITDPVIDTIEHLLGE